MQCLICSVPAVLLSLLIPVEVRLLLAFDATVAVDVHPVSHHLQNSVHLLEIERIREAGSEVDHYILYLPISNTLLIVLIVLKPSALKALEQARSLVWVQNVLVMLEALVDVAV